MKRMKRHGTALAMSHSSYWVLKKMIARTVKGVIQATVYCERRHSVPCSGCSSRLAISNSVHTGRVQSIRSMLRTILCY